MADDEPGKTYLGFYCENCSEPITVIEDPSDGKVSLGGFGRFRLTCQKCAHVAYYSSAGLPLII